MKCTVGSGYEWIYKQLMQLYTLFSWRQATNVVVLTMETHDHISTFSTSGHLSIQICYIPNIATHYRAYIKQKSLHDWMHPAPRPLPGVTPSACNARPSSSFPLASQRAGRVRNVPLIESPVCTSLSSISGQFFPFYFIQSVLYTIL